MNVPNLENAAGDFKPPSPAVADRPIHYSPTGGVVTLHEVQGEPPECKDDCPACHWPGNTLCPALATGCDICAETPP